LLSLAKSAVVAAGGSFLKIKISGIITNSRI
jgi:hypothetical protein